MNQPGQCLCHSGWTGENCEVPIKRLIASTKPPSRCENGGRWMKSGSCQCPKEFRGEFCEERICLNGGLSSSNQCICPPGYEGQQCELESSCPICRNNGRCENKKCQCSKEFIGQYCEIDIRLIQKKETKIFSLELLTLFFVLFTFLFILISLSYIFYRYSHRRRQQQLRQLKEINLEKIWTIEHHSTNLFKEQTNEKLPEKKDINLKLKQTDIQASLV